MTIPTECGNLASAVKRTFIAKQSDDREKCLKPDARNAAVRCRKLAILKSFSSASAVFAYREQRQNMSVA